MSIKWKLAAIMADRECSNKTLSELTDFHEVTISKLRGGMPDRLEKVTLERLCVALQCQPGDLMEWVESDEIETEKPTSEKTSRVRGKNNYQSKNTRALRASATKTRVTVWQDLRKPLSINNNESTIT